VRLWSSRAGTSADQVDRAWQAFLRRFDIEHAFPFFKQALGWTRPKLRGPAAADRGPGSSLPCYAQLHLARRLAADIRLPWQRPSPPGRPATRHDVGKTAKRDDPKKETRRQNGYITS
jgi:hypothetical protein